MSREIDMSDPGSWSEDDLLYLAQRDRLPDDLKREINNNPDSLKALQEKLYPQTPLDETPQSGTVLPATSNVADDAESDSDDDEGEEDYDEGWTNDDRRTELTRRGLSIEGNKAELIARLVEDDQSDDNSEDEE
jgi:hypothetical protein